MSLQINGTVLDDATGNPLPSATLSVNGKAVGAAGSNGDFSLQVESYSDTITASSVGYSATTMPAYQVAESGTISLTLADDSLQAATVTATTKKKISPWWILAGVAVIASTQKGSSSSTMGRSGSSNLIPIAALGVGAYLLLKPRQPVYSPYPNTGINPPISSSSSPISSILSPGGLSSIVDIAKNLFGSWSTSSTSENTPSGNYSSYDPTDSGGSDMAGTAMGATTTVNAGDIIGHNLVAAMRVPVYDQANDNAQPSGYISAGQTIGKVYSFLNADPSQGRSTLWWMFEPLPGNSDIGDSEGFYYTPHNPDYFNFQALSDSGVLTVAQATALKNGTEPSTAEKLLNKYLPWVIGGLVAVGIGKAIINKAI